MLQALFARRHTARAWGIIVPAVIAGLWAAHGWEHDRLAGALPYSVVVLACVVYFFRPMWILWLAITAAFVGYTVWVIVQQADQPIRVLLAYMFHGFVPLLLLWFARPKEDPPALPRAGDAASAQ
jgi:hypothetical protein